MKSFYLKPFFISLLLHVMVGTGALAFISNAVTPPTLTQIEIISADEKTFRPLAQKPLNSSKKYAEPQKNKDIKTIAKAENAAQETALNESKSSTGSEATTNSVNEEEIFSPTNSPHPYFKKVWKRLYQANSGMAIKVELNSNYKIRITLDKDGKISRSEVHGDIDQISKELRRRLQRMAYLPPIPDEISQNQIVLQYEVSLTSSRL